MYQEPKNSRALAKAILFLLENKELRKKMGINARKRVLKYFTLEKMIGETFEIY
ncbi:MAG: glycosyltransferase, partial [Candidatus Aenigmatarchaeota archaeon]